MKVSVLIPTRNRPDYVREAVFSAAASAFDRRFEIIVVHDGEAVQPLTGVMSVALARPSGKAACLNRAFAASTGDYVTVLDDDDQIMPHKLALMSAMLDADLTTGAIYALPQYLYADGRAETPARLRTWLHHNPVVTWDTIVQRRGLRMHGTATMYRRTAWETAGPWDETLTTGEEWEYHLRLLRSGCVFRALDTVTDLYRIHATQKSGRRRRRLASRMAVIARINQRYEVPEAEEVAV